MTVDDFFLGRRYAGSNLANFRFVAWVESKTLFSKDPEYLCYLTWRLNHWICTWFIF